MMPRASLRQCGREEARECRHEHDVAAVGHGPGERLDLGRVADDAEVVAQPADQRARDGDGPFEGVRGRAGPEARRDRRDQAVGRVDRPPPGVHEHEAAGAVGALELAGLEAGLAEEGRLLVAEIARDGDAGEIPDPRPVDLRRRPDRGQHRRGHADRVEELGLPGQRVEAHQHRPGGIRRVGHVDAAVDPAGQVPDEPRVDRPEQQVAGGCRGASLASAVIEDPGQLERRGIGRDGQAGQCPEAVGAERIAGGQTLARPGRPRVLPDDRVVDRPPGPARPDHGRLALVADARPRPARAHRRPRHATRPGRRSARARGSPRHRARPSRVAG